MNRLTQTSASIILCFFLSACGGKVDSSQPLSPEDDTDKSSDGTPNVDTLRDKKLMMSIYPDDELLPGLPNWNHPIESGTSLGFQNLEFSFSNRPAGQPFFVGGPLWGNSGQIISVKAVNAQDKTRNQVFYREGLWALRIIPEFTGSNSYTFEIEYNNGDKEIAAAYFNWTSQLSQTSIEVVKHSQPNPDTPYGIKKSFIPFLTFDIKNPLPSSIRCAVRFDSEKPSLVKFEPRTDGQKESLPPETPNLIFIQSGNDQSQTPLKPLGEWAEFEIPGLSTQKITLAIRGANYFDYSDYRINFDLSLRVDVIVGRIESPLAQLIAFHSNHSGTEAVSYQYFHQWGPAPPGK